MERRHSTAYTVGFAAVICLVCAVAVSSLSVALKPRQDANRELDRQKNVLIAARLLDPSSDAEGGDVAALFERRVTPVATREGLTVYEVREDGRLDMVVLPVEGKGLWSTLYGFLALDADTTTVRGLAFYQHGETPGLGGEIENPKWTALWVGRKAFDERWRPAIRVIKGAAGAPSEDPHRVDGLSGATITSNGVSRLVERWLGDEGYGPYLAEVRKGGGK
jgi:Na+-transporting NADH:ubiquinone oxidoreductase subunit C